MAGARRTGTAERVSGTDVLELKQLAARYWRMADGTLAVPVQELFTDEAVFVLGSLKLEGIAAIADFFAERDRRRLTDQRTTRHIACNELYVPKGRGRMLVKSTVLVYSGAGALPLPAAAPTGIADFEDQCMRVTPGCWKYARRDARSVFVGETAPAFAR